MSTWHSSPAGRWKRNSTSKTRARRWTAHWNTSWCSWSRRGSRPRSERPAGSPAQLVQPVIADAEMVPDLVDHGAAHLLDDLGVVAADRADRQPVDRDPVRQDR